MKRLVLKNEVEVKIARDILLADLSDYINKNGELDWNSKLVEKRAYIYGLADNREVYVDSLTYVMCELECNFRSEVSDDFERIIFRKN